MKRNIICPTFESLSEMGWKSCLHNFMLYMLMYNREVACQAVHNLNKNKGNRCIQKDEVKEEKKGTIL